MKISLGIVFLFFALVHSGITFFVDDDIGDKIDSTKFIEILNDIRLKVSKHSKVSNMNELSWDDDLVTKADKLDCDNGNDDGPTFNVVAFPNRNDFYKLSHSSEQEAVKLFERLIFPVHSKVGCTKHLCQNVDRFFCALSPKVEISEKLIKKGRPGTECASGSNKDGLCLPGEFETAEAYETPEHRGGGPEDDRKFISGGPEDDRRTNEMKSNFDSNNSPSNLQFEVLTLVLSLVMIYFGL